jgi:hypothetical protein
MTSYKDSTLTTEDFKKIADFLEGRHIPAGLGTVAEACSIAAINLALTGRLTDTIPECMSPVVGKWIIKVQDAMPDDLRNSAAWKELIPFAAGTGRANEAERRAIILDWMWGTVLPTLQPIADKRGFGDAWKAMTEGRTRALAVAARTSARAVGDAAVAAAYVADAAANAANAAAVAAVAAAYAADAADANAANADAADANAANAADAVRRPAWSTFDPAGLLQRLISLD